MWPRDEMDRPEGQRKKKEARLMWPRTSLLFGEGALPKRERKSAAFLYDFTGRSPFAYQEDRVYYYITENDSDKIRDQAYTGGILTMKRIIMAIMLLVFLCGGSAGLVFVSGQAVTAEETGIQETGAVPVMLDDITLLRVKAVVDQVYARNYWLPGGEYDFSKPLVPIQIKASELTSEDRADFLYWYVSSHFAAEDPRVVADESDFPTLYGVYRDRITEMITDLTGNAEEEDVQTYMDAHCETVDDTAAYVWGQTGGQYPGCHFSEESEVTIEDGRLKISGTIIKDDHSEVPYILYCVPRENGIFGGYVFDELIVDADGRTAEEQGSEENGGVSAGVQNAEMEWLIPDSFSATSVHYTEGVDSYEPARINDGDVTTGWVEGVDGSGIGEYVELTYPGDIVFHSVWIVPGFCKREDLFYRNNVPVELEFSSGGKSVAVDISSAAGDYYQAAAGTEFVLPGELPCDGTLRVTIRNVWPGSEWDDTVISELKMKGYHRTEDAAALSQPESDEDVFGIFAGQYLFTSGAGGWSTEMEITPDGTFSGQYQDLDMGVGAEDYDSTLYRSVFRGSFTNPQKIDQYTCSFELEDIQYENQPGTETIESGDSWRTRVVYTEAYGLDQGTDLIHAYTAGTPMGMLPDGMMSWIGLLIGEEAKDSGVLPCNCLFMVKPEYGWVGISE